MEKDNTTSSVEDLKSLRNWILGIIGFATAVSTTLVQVFHFRPEPTVVTVAGFASALVLIVVLIKRSEDRQRRMLADHMVEAEKNSQGFTTRLDSIDDVLLDIQRSTLRTEICNEMARHPDNHDSILRMAEKYFGKHEDGGLGANWYMASKFLDWAEKEGVKVPPHIQVTQK